MGGGGLGVGVGVEGMGERSGLLSRERRGVPVVMVVATDWFREVRVERAARCREGIMRGPGRRWAFVRCAQVAMARGPRVYWDWRVSRVRRGYC